MNKLTFDTIHGTIRLNPAFDTELGDFYTMYDENGGYYGEIFCYGKENLLTPEMIEEQIEENLYS